MSEKDEEEKMVSERTITFRGFKDAESAKKFLDKTMQDLERTHERFNRFFEGTRKLFSDLDALMGFTPTPPKAIDEEIKYHERKLAELKKRKALPDG